MKETPLLGQGRGWFTHRLPSPGPATAQLPECLAWVPVPVREKWQGHLEDWAGRYTSRKSDMLLGAGETEHGASWLHRENAPIFGKNVGNGR